MATQDECRTGIRREWAKQKPKRRPSHEAERRAFYIWLGQNRPSLLMFHVARGQDKWECVNDWLCNDWFHLNPHAWADLFRTKFVTEVDTFGHCLFKRLLPAFRSVPDEADEVQQAAYRRMDQSPWEDSDPASEYERGMEEAAEYLNTMLAIQQGAMNLFGAGLYHLVEQQLLYFHRSVVLPPGAEQWAIARKCQQQLFSLGELKDQLLIHGIELTALLSWPRIDQLRLIANTVKHTEGPACDELRQKRPELFVRMEDRVCGIPAMQGIPVYQPLFGEGLYLGEHDLREFVDAAKAFWVEFADELGRVSE